MIFFLENHDSQETGDMRKYERFSFFVHRRMLHTDYPKIEDSTDKNFSIFLYIGSTSSGRQTTQKELTQNCDTF